MHHHAGPHPDGVLEGPMPVSTLKLLMRFPGLSHGLILLGKKKKKSFPETHSTRVLSALSIWQNHVLEITRGLMRLRINLKIYIALQSEN